jgi:type I restriction enzyme S subunit
MNPNSDNMKYNYIESGIEWIGKVPKHWKVDKLKRLLSEKLKYGATESGDLDNPDDPRYIRITDFDDDGSLREDTFKSLPPHVAKDYLLKEGDVLFARSGATVGKTFLFTNYNGIACFAGYLIKATTIRYKLLPEFLFYYTKSNAYEDWKNVIFTQATIQNIGADKYQYLNIPVPSISEQTAIATYLDKACADIDRVVEIKRKQIDNLQQQLKSIIHHTVTKGLKPNAEMKNSGIDWIGEVPLSWKRRRIKDIVKLQSGDNITSEKITEDDEFPVYGGNGLRGYYNQFTHEGEYVLIGRQGALCGNINYASDKFWASEHAVVATPIYKTDTFWLGEILRVMNLNQYSNSAAQPGLSVEKIKNLYFVVPTYTEQTKISECIRRYSEQSQTVQSKIEKQIETLITYKKSLIHEVVTGKKQVFGITPKAKA